MGLWRKCEEGVLRYYNVTDFLNGKVLTEYLDAAEPMRTDNAGNWVQNIKTSFYPPHNAFFRSERMMELMQKYGPLCYKSAHGCHDRSATMQV